jgi:hypothetical protein
MRRAVPGTGRSCATGGPWSAPLIPPFSLSPPHAVKRMGGRLKDFSPFWKDVLGCTPYALEAVTGFRPHFITLPPLALPGPHLCTPSKGKNDHFIDKEVEAPDLEIVPTLSGVLIINLKNFCETHGSHYLKALCCGQRYNSFWSEPCFICSYFLCRLSMQ